MKTVERRIFASCLGRTFRLSGKTREHIFRRPEIRGELKKIGDVLEKPDEVRGSIHDTTVLLFYKFYPTTKVTSNYLVVAVKTLNEEGFIITAFFTDRMKRGVTVWRRS